MLYSLETRVLLFTNSFIYWESGALSVRAYGHRFVLVKDSGDHYKFNVVRVFRSLDHALSSVY